MMSLPVFGTWGGIDEVTKKIYGTNELKVQALAIGHQPVGMYRNRSRAAYWDGRNQHGESLASGISFCTLKAGDIFRNAEDDCQ